MASSALGIILHLIPGVCRDLASNLHHHVKHLNLECLMFQQQVACVLSYCRDGKYQSGCRMASATWKQPGGMSSGQPRGSAGVLQLPTAEHVTSNETILRAGV